MQKSFLQTGKRAAKTEGLFIATLILAAGAWLILRAFVAPAWLAYTQINLPHEKVEAFNKLAIAFGAAIAASFGSVLALWRTWSLHKATVSQIQSTQLSDQKYRTEAFTKAVELLGHENFSVRIGAIYALEQLCKQDPYYVKPVVDVLTSLIRRTLPIDDERNIDTESELKMIVQAAINVIGSEVMKLNRPLLYLYNCDLREIIIHGNFNVGQYDATDFSNSNCNGSSFESSAFRKARFQDNVMHCVKMDNSSFDRADISGARFTMSTLRGARFTAVNMTNAEFLEVDFSGAHINYCDMGGVSFVKCNLSNVDFEESLLEEVIFIECVMDGVMNFNRSL